MNKDRKQDFLNWYEEFVKKYKGKVPNTPEKWYDDIEKSHEEIRKLIGGIEKLLNVEIPPEIIPLSYFKVIEYHQLIGSILPNYFVNNKLSYIDLYCETIPHLKNIKVTKHIAAYAKKEKLSKELHKRLLNVLSNLSKEYQSQTKLNQKIEILISTCQKVMMQVGHFEVDESACFGQGKFNEDKRYTFFNEPNTFVILIKKDNKIVNRRIGFLNSTLNVANFINPYTKGITEKSILDATVYAAEAILNAKNLKVEFDKATIKGGGLYNHGPCYTFYTKPSLDIEDYTLIAKGQYPTNEKL